MNVAFPWKEERIAQIRLPAPDDKDPHPRLLVNNYGLHAGDVYEALLPDGWHEVTLEVDWEITGPACWYISNPEYSDVSPLGLFVHY